MSLHKYSRGVSATAVQLISNSPVSNSLSSSIYFKTNPIHSYIYYGYFIYSINVTKARSKHRLSLARISHDDKIEDIPVNIAL